MPRLSIYILFLILCSCSNSAGDDLVFDANTFPQRWELTGMSTGLSGGFLEGDDLPWTETIVLEKDSRFFKTRSLDNEESEGKGVFDLIEINNGMYLILNYDAETDLIESCGIEKRTETLFMPSVKALIGGSAPCDGPGLFYKRIE